MSKKHHYTVNIDLDTTTLLFPINLKDIIIDPKNNNYDNKKYPKMISLIKKSYNTLRKCTELKNLVKEKEFDEKISDEEYIFTHKLNNTEEDVEYLPITIFYLYFVYFNDEEYNDLLEKKYLTKDEFFESVEYPNPFIPTNDLKETKIISFKPFLLNLCESEFDESTQKMCTATLPSERHLQNNSTLDYDMLRNDIDYETEKLPWVSQR